MNHNKETIFSNPQTCDKSDNEPCSTATKSHLDCLQVTIHPESGVGISENTEVDHVKRKFILCGLLSQYCIKVLNRRRVIGFIAIMCLMMLVLHIPIVLYYTDKPQPFSTDFGSVEFEVVEATSSLLENCTKVMNFSYSDYQNCELNSTAIISLHSIYGIGLMYDNDKCVTEDTLSFFCNATFLLCNGSSILVDSTEECENIRDNKCASEWRILEDKNVINPDCSSYGEDGNLTFSLAPLFECPDQFDRENGSSICLPVCDEFTLYPEYVASWFRVVIPTGEIIRIIGGLVTLLACCCNQQTVFRIPQIFVVYSTIIWTITGVVVVVPYLVNMHLLCSTNNVFGEPTVYCQVQGFIVQTCITCFLGFWCFHVLHLFLSLAFPFGMKRLMESSSVRRNIHIVEVVIVVLLSLISPSLALVITEYQYDGYFCRPKSHSFLFYGVVLPGTVQFAIGLSLYLGAIWIIQRENRSKSRRSSESRSCRLGCSVPEFKLIALFFYYALTMSLQFLTLMLFIQNTDELEKYLYLYIFCSTGGYREECDAYKEKAFDSFTSRTILGVFVLLLISFLNYSHLMYVVQFSSIKKKIMKLFS